MNIVFTTALILCAVLLLTRIKVRLNKGSRIKWSIALFALLLRLGLTIWEYSIKDFNLTTTKYYILWLLDQVHFMIMLMLFLSVIGSWQIVSQFGQRPNQKERSNSVGTDENFTSTLEKLKGQKKKLNKRVFFIQGVYALLSLALTIELQIINTLIKNQSSSVPSNGTVSKGLFWSELFLTVMICLFELYIGVLTTKMLMQSIVKTKWPVYLTIWLLLFSYLAVQLFQSFLYAQTEFLNITHGTFNVELGRLLALIVHEILIYLAMFLIVWHTYRINAHTIELVKQIEIRKSKAVAANRSNNRRTGNFNSARLQLDENGKLIVVTELNINLTESESTIRGTVNSEKDQSNNFKADSKKNTVIFAPAPAEIPKKAGVRMAMEHKLGIDWEHGDEKRDEMNQSVQTDMMIDGYDEMNSNMHKSLLEHSDRSRSGSQVMGTLREEYKNMSRKYSFNAPGDEDDANEQNASFDSDHYLEMRKQQVMETIFLDKYNPYKL